MFLLYVSLSASLGHVRSVLRSRSVRALCSPSVPLFASIAVYLLFHVFLFYLLDSCWCLACCVAALVVACCRRRCRRLCLLLFAAVFAVVAVMAGAGVVV